MSPKNKKITLINSSNQQSGFSHLIIPLVVVVLGVGGTACLVYKANHNKAQTVNLASGKTSTVKGASTQSKSNTTSPKPASTIATSTPATTSSSKTTTSSTSTTTKTTTPSIATSPATVPTPAATPLSTLTNIITGLQKGISTQVTVNSVTVAGPITDAKARPIVFSLNGTTYFAYTQEQKPNFNLTPAQTAGTMAIITTTNTGPLTSAYLDKGNFLVDPNQSAVGFSTGGD